MKGVDISHYQKGSTIWQLKDAGFDFAIIKLTEGISIVDKAAFEFYREAYELGFPVGCYCYSHATTAKEAAAEAGHLLDTLNGFPMPCGVFLDVEEPKQLELSHDALLDVLDAWCAGIVQHGYIPGVYGSEGNLWTKIKPNELPDGTMIWVAKWSQTPPNTPCDLWQTSDCGHVEGHNGNVDIDAVRSNRFKTLVETGGHEITYHKRKLAGDSEPEPPSEQQKSDACPIGKADPIIMSLQMIMSYAGCWPNEADGLASPEFFEAARTLLNDLEKG